MEVMDESSLAPKRPPDDEDELERQAALALLCDGVVPPHGRGILTIFDIVRHPKRGLVISKETKLV